MVNSPDGAETPLNHGYNLRSRVKHDSATVIV